MIAERIKELREEKAWTQTELAKILGVTRSCVNAWEMGISGTLDAVCCRTCIAIPYFYRFSAWSRGNGKR